MVIDCCMSHNCCQRQICKNFGEKIANKMRSCDNGTDFAKICSEKILVISDANFGSLLAREHTRIADAATRAGE